MESDSIRTFYKTICKKGSVMGIRCEMCIHFSVCWMQKELDTEMAEEMVNWCKFFKEEGTE